MKKNFIDILSVIIANLVSIVVSIVLVLIIPKLVSVEEYGYWQLYIFYTSYVGFLHFGHIDGIYLKYGGLHYSDIKKSDFKLQFIQLSISQLIIGTIIICVLLISPIQDIKFFIIFMTVINMILVNVRMYFQYILQSTGTIKKYSLTVMFERILYVLLIITVLVVMPITIQNLVYVDIITKACALLLVMYYCKDIILSKNVNNIRDTKEFVYLIKIGSNLMLANIASMLIIGIIRFSIEHKSGIETFGKVSLTLSIANFLMIFITAIGVVLYPIMRRMDSEKVQDFYGSIRAILMTFISITLILYFPISHYLSDYLPKYKESLMYAGILFPMILFESKTILLINTYLKNIRKEKILLFINVVSFLLSLTSTVILMLLNAKIEWFVISITIILFIRSLIGEYFISKYLNINIILVNLIEMMLATIFILLALNMNWLIGMLYYFIAWLTFIGFNLKHITSAIKFINK